MISLQKYLTESNNESFTFDIYNEGPKNTDFKITKNILMHEIQKYNIRMNGVCLYLPLSANQINWKKDFEDDVQQRRLVNLSINTDDFRNFERQLEKNLTVNLREIHKDEHFTEWLRSLKQYTKAGKISVTMEYDSDRSLWVATVNDEKFNRERESKIKERTKAYQPIIKKLKDEYDEHRHQRTKKDNGLDSYYDDDSAYYGKRYYGD